MKDQRTASAYIFGAICPALGKAAGLVMPSCNTEAMTLHLQEIALAVEPGAHAVLFVDQAGWHVTAKLGVPENITLVPLPSKSPELNPVENIWQYMRDNWLSNRIFANYEDILDHCCFNWNKLAKRRWLGTELDGDLRNSNRIFLTMRVARRSCSLGAGLSALSARVA